MTRGKKENKGQAGLTGVARNERRTASSVSNFLLYSILATEGDFHVCKG